MSDGAKGGAAKSDAPTSGSPDSERAARPPAEGRGGMPLPTVPSMDRRMALKVMAVAAAAPGMLACDPDAGADPSVPATAPSPESNPLARGTPTDPDLVAPEIPWERILTDDELRTLASLCDVIIPEDERSPSASAVGAHHFIDEWVSAPYPAMERDRVRVRGGIVWLDAEAVRRFDVPRFRDLPPEGKHAICDDICHRPDADEEFRAASRFFDKVRDLTATAFYSTDEGMEDVGYVGNEALASWGPPPPEALRHVGLGP